MESYMKKRFLKLKFLDSRHDCNYGDFNNYDDCDYDKNHDMELVASSSTKNLHSCCTRCYSTGIY